LLAVVGTVLVTGMRQSPTLAAFGGLGQDLDDDGLSDIQEEVLCTSPVLPDTDGDEYSDLEEITRQSDPRSRFDFPGPHSPKTGMVGRVIGGGLTTLFALYVEGGNMAELEFQFGISYRGTVVPLDLGAYQGATHVSLHNAKQSADKILVLETCIPDAIIHAYGSLSFWGIHRGDGSGSGDSATALNLTSFLGHTLSIEPSPISVGHGEGVINRPIESGSAIPGDWSGGEICWQKTTLVGVNGASIIYEVEDAACEQMDTYCKPVDCEATVGSIIELVDPGALIGG